MEATGLFWERGYKKCFYASRLKSKILNLLKTTKFFFVQLYKVYVASSIQKISSNGYKLHRMDICKLRMLHSCYKRSSLLLGVVNHLSRPCIQLMVLYNRIGALGLLLGLEQPKLQLTEQERQLSGIDIT